MDSLSLPSVICLYFALLTLSCSPQTVTNGTTLAPETSQKSERDAATHLADSDGRFDAMVRNDTVASDQHDGRSVANDAPICTYLGRRKVSPYYAHYFPSVIYPHQSGGYVVGGDYGRLMRYQNNTSSIEWCWSMNDLGGCYGTWIAQHIKEGGGSGAFNGLVSEVRQLPTGDFLIRFERTGLARITTTGKEIWVLNDNDFFRTNWIGPSGLELLALGQVGEVLVSNLSTNRIDRFAVKDGKLLGIFAKLDFATRVPSMTEARDRRAIWVAVTDVSGNLHAISRNSKTGLIQSDTVFAGVYSYDPWLTSGIGGRRPRLRQRGTASMWLFHIGQDLRYRVVRLDPKGKVLSSVALPYTYAHGAGYMEFVAASDGEVAYLATGITPKNDVGRLFQVRGAEVVGQWATQMGARIQDISVDADHHVLLSVGTDEKFINATLSSSLDVDRQVVVLDAWLREDCRASGVCHDKPSDWCDDDNPCTRDRCLPVQGLATCEFVPLPNGVTCAATDAQSGRQCWEGSCML